MHHLVNPFSPPSTQHPTPPHHKQAGSKKECHPCLTKSTDLGYGLSHLNLYDGLSFFFGRGKRIVKRRMNFFMAWSFQYNLLFEVGTFILLSSHHPPRTHTWKDATHYTIIHRYIHIRTCTSALHMCAHARTHAFILRCAHSCTHHKHIISHTHPFSFFTH